MACESELDLAEFGAYSLVLVLTGILLTGCLITAAFNANRAVVSVLGWLAFASCIAACAPLTVLGIAALRHLLALVCLTFTDFAPILVGLLALAVGVHALKN